MKKSCPFCNCDHPVLENSLAYAIYDRYPVNEGHLLVIPKRHFSDFFECRKEEVAAIFNLLLNAKGLLDDKYRPDGYNIGINCGLPSGQTIMHLHVHLIPRYQGDMEDPTGGVRGVIPAKQKYPTGQPN
ncbi:MAG: HIT family protein [Deltaproteobacteria bacterium]|nr:HIT family protein [Deltaproteobacteria bacterium]